MNARFLLLLAVATFVGLASIHAEEAKATSWWETATAKCSSALESTTKKSGKYWDSTKEKREKAAAAATAVAEKAWNAAESTSIQAWDLTKATSIKAWDATREDREKAAAAAKDAAEKAWTASKDKSAQMWESTREDREKAAAATKAAAELASESAGRFYDNHKTEIQVGTVAVAAILAYKLNQELAVDSPPALQSNGGPYSYLSDPSGVGPGKDFTTAQKAQIFSQNRERNGGLLVSDKSGAVLAVPGRYVKDYDPDPSEAQVDHIIPKSAGGTNSLGNAQLLSREENLAKGATPP